MAEIGFARLEEAFAAADRLAAGRAGAGPERVRGTVLATLDFYLANRRLFALMFLTPEVGTRRYPADFEAKRSPAFELLRRGVEDAMGRGELARDDALEVALSLWAHAHGLISLYHVGRFEADDVGFRALFRRSLERLFEGLVRS